MKKKVTIEKDFCDVCGKEASGYTKCDSCGKELCYECGETELKEYNHAVHFQGSSNGKYCHECDAKLLANGDKKHAAYRKIAALRNEEIIRIAIVNGNVTISSNEIRSYSADR